VLERSLLKSNDGSVSLDRTKMTAQVRLIAGSVMKEESRSSLGRVVVLSLCVGLFYGLLEAVLLLSLYDFSRLAMWQNGVSARILWVGPVVDGALFLCLGYAWRGSLPWFVGPMNVGRGH